MPRVNLLIADDVGLGKTIETGLVIQELLLRHRARTVLVICPSALQVQWQEQMRDKFGLPFRIVDSDLVKDLRRRRGLHVNPWAHFPRLITSIDFIKRERPLELYKQLLPPDGKPRYPRSFDILVIDEAHNVAPAGRGRYATDSLRTAAVRTLAPHFEHKLFLSATPHNGYRESFTALLELLDSQRFTRVVDPDPRQLQRIMVRRLKRELPARWDGRPRFPDRCIEPIEIDYPVVERDLHRALKRYADHRMDADMAPAEALATELVLKLLKKRLFSSPAAFLATLQQHRKALTRPRRATSAAQSVGVLRARIEGLCEEFADDAVLEEHELALTESASELFRSVSSDDLADLDTLIPAADQLTRRGDAKAARLIDWLEAHVRPDGAWSDRRVIIFTEYRATQTCPQPVPATLQQDLQHVWPDIRDGVLKALERRMQDRTKNLQGFLDDRMASETAEMHEVLTELARSIQSELARAEEPLQLDLWSDAERDQRDRDSANLRARLDSIPDEIAREEANIRRRYADPVSRLLPVAVTFLVPERHVTT